jgi:flagellar basal-body rod protein FlgB
LFSIGTVVAKGLNMKLLGTVDRLAVGLDYHQARHAVLTANLANVDTPQYRARDVERTDFDGALKLAMASTDNTHFGAAKAGLQTKVTIDETTPADADGNAVSLDKETVKITANSVRYETISTLVQSQLAMMAYAAGDGRGA